jgi:hypothetical protein
LIAHGTRHDNSLQRIYHNVKAVSPEFVLQWFWVELEKGG